ncbi:MAG: c-type cytochrome [Burkholderiales bacterium]|jgi:cytochrome c|nr:c-type cytochrome [Burkholderiales bacterium]
MKKMLLLLPFAALLATGIAQAESGEDLTKKYKCTACHKADKKAIGPSYQEIAKKNAGKADAAAHLFDDVRKGSRGVWGNAPMPPQTQPSDEDLKAMVNYILSVK